MAMRSGTKSLLALAGLAMAAGHAWAQGEEHLGVERLLKDGWEIAGYTGTFDNRSSLLLFKHRDAKYLVQCSILHDVTRGPRRTITNCYEVR